LVGALGGILVVFFFFQAEDGIRDFHVTGVQTCALPISPRVLATPSKPPSARSRRANGWQTWRPSKACTSGRRSIAAYTGSCRLEIGRASCRERVEDGGVGVGLKCRTAQCGTRVVDGAAR